MLEPSSEGFTIQGVLYLNFLIYFISMGELSTELKKGLGDKILFSLKISFDVILFIEFIEDNIPECVYGNLKNSK